MNLSTQAAQPAHRAAGAPPRPSAAKKRNKTLNRVLNNYQLYLFLLPAVVIVIIFNYVPLYGVQIAFKNFIITRGISGSPWVGFKQFESFFQSFYFGQLLRNTFLISVYSLLYGFPIPIILALLLNQFPYKRYKKVIQTVTYAPYFISTVVVCGMIFVFLNPRSGLLSQAIALFGSDAVNFMGDPKYFRTIYIGSDIWQSAGWSTIIYLAALAGVSTECHEAAIVDGATKLQRILHIDIPGIMPTAIILLILNLGGLMSVGYEKAYLLQNSLNSSTSSIISTYVYKVGLIDNRLSFSSAVGLFNSLINMVMLLTVNWIAGRVSETSLW